VRNPIAAIELNAEMLQEIVRGQGGSQADEAVSLVTAIRDQVNTLDGLTEEYLAFARFPKPHFEEESINHLLQELADFVRPVATRQGLTLHVEVEYAAVGQPLGTFYLFKFSRVDPATDPAAVVATFKRLRVPPALW